MLCAPDFDTQTCKHAIKLPPVCGGSVECVGGLECCCLLQAVIDHCLWKCVLPHIEPEVLDVCTFLLDHGPADRCEICTPEAHKHLFRPHFSVQLPNLNQGTTPSRRCIRKKRRIIIDIQGSCQHTICGYGPGRPPRSSAIFSSQQKVFDFDGRVNFVPVWPRRGCCAKPTQNLKVFAEQPNLLSKSRRLTLQFEGQDQKHAHTI